MTEQAFNLHTLVEQRASLHPDRTALVCDSDKLSYGELNARANQLAHSIINSGLCREGAVGLLLARSIDFVVGALAILKAGCTYVPLDPDYPPARLEMMRAAANIRMVITNRGMAGQLAHRDVLLVDAVSDEPDDNPNVPVFPDNLAYVMFTSGSTGTPKGVLVTHRGIIRLVVNPGDLRLNESEIVLHASSISFDASTFEIWGALVNGGCLVLAPAGQLSVLELGAVLRKHRVTTAFFTTGLFHVLVDECLKDLANLTQVVVGGDVMSATVAGRLLAAHPDCRLLNGYGPTEMTTFTTCQVVGGHHVAEGSIPIGGPIRKTWVRILDENMREVGTGETGMLYAGGDGAARGYVSDTALTAQRFVPDPFSVSQRLYRTGDLARYRSDGSIDFLGRADQQVKRRGFRIEPIEIEEALRGLTQVGDAAVVAEGSNADDRTLVAYVATEPSDMSSIEMIKAQLGRSLPGYMMPDRWVILDALPLNPNGKVDKRALVNSTLSGRTGTAPFRDGEPRTDGPLGPVESAIAQAWCEVFGLPQVGRHDDFFDLGGHSLIASRLVSRLRHSLGQRIPLAAVFDYPTVAQLAEVVGLPNSRSVEDVFG